MASLTKAQIGIIKNVVIKRSPREKFTVNWQRIFQVFAIGEPDGAEKYIYFSGRDWDLLREMVKLDTGFDVFDVDFNQPRQTLATQGHKEKFASIRPDADYVLVKCSLAYQQHYSSLSVADDPSVALLQSCSSISLRMPVEQVLNFCQQSDIRHIVVVENLDSFDHCHDMFCDDELADQLMQTLFVYRGGGLHSPAGCKRFLQHIAIAKQAGRLSPSVSAFVDLDPAGLQIALLLTGCASIIIPVQANWSAQNNDMPSQLSDINDPDDFHKQWRQQKYLNHVDLGELNRLAMWIQQNSVSIKQQHILAHRFQLTQIFFSL